MGETKGGLSVIAEALKQYETILNSSKEEFISAISEKLTDISSRIANIEVRLEAIEERIILLSEKMTAGAQNATVNITPANEKVADMVYEENAASAEPEEVEVFAEAEEDRYNFNEDIEPEADDFEPEPDIEELEEEEEEEEGEDVEEAGIVENKDIESDDTESETPENDNDKSHIVENYKKEKKDWYDWEVDYPAEYVDDLVKSMGINDKMQFISELFNGHKFEFDMVMSEINSMKSFKDIVNYFRDEYPQWDEDSDTIYKFYMHIRRKFRN